MNNEQDFDFTPSLRLQFVFHQMGRKMKEEKGRTFFFISSAQSKSKKKIVDREFVSNESRLWYLSYECDCSRVWWFCRPPNK